MISAVGGPSSSPTLLMLCGWFGVERVAGDPVRCRLVGGGAAGEVRWDGFGCATSASVLIV